MIDMDAVATTQRGQTRAAPTLLVVDDEPATRRSLVRALDDEPYDVVQASSGDEALEILGKRRVHVVLSDHNMPGMTGLEFLRHVKLRWPTVARLMVTANDEFDTAVRAINVGEVSRFIRKPWDDEELRCSIRRAFELVALEREVRALRAEARRHLSVLRDLESRHPGISRVDRDARGAILIERELDGDERLTFDALWRDE
jgi:DNA-binding NtrC family response regulator